MGSVPSTSENFGDLITPGFKLIFENVWKEVPDTIGDWFDLRTDHQNKAYMKFSSVGPYSDWQAFTGTVNYQGATQGYDTTINFPEYATGFKIERKLFDDKEYNVMNLRPEGLARALRRYRAKYAASLLNEAFSTVPSDMDGVTLCSASHPYSSEDAGIQSNTGTTAFSATSVSATKLLMRKFKDPARNLFDCNMDMLIVPPDLEEAAWEIINTKGKVDVADNNMNFHFGKYKLLILADLSDTNNWFAIDSYYMKKFNIWVDRIAAEFAKDRDSDTYVSKFSGYARFDRKWVDWRWIYGHNAT